MVRTTRRGNSANKQQYLEQMKQEEEEEELEESPEVQDHPNHRNAGDAFFTLDGRPARFHMYQGGFGELTDGQIDALKPKILAHGAEICDEEADADTILVNEEGIDYLERKWWKSKTIYVYTPRFVQMCINTRGYENHLRPPIRKGMGGLPSAQAKKRVQYTAEDDAHLCAYLAAVVPDKDEGGRGGQVIYKRLVEDADIHEEDSWGKRHPWSSWQERYKTQKHRFDPIIARLVAENPPRADGKGLYERSRYLNKRNVRVYDPGSDDITWEDIEVTSDPEDEWNGVEVDTASEHEEGSSRVHSSQKRARYNDGTVQLSDVEQTRRADRGRPYSYSRPNNPEHVAKSFSSNPQTPINRSFSQNLSSTRRSVSVFGNDLQFIDLDLREKGYRPGPEDAGPSGTQRTPTPVPATPATMGPPRAKVQGNPRPWPRPDNKASVSRSAVPMSSQATLVGTQAGPSQLRRDQARPQANDADEPYAEPVQPQRRPAAKQTRPSEGTGAAPNAIAVAKKRKRRINAVAPPPGVPYVDDTRVMARHARNVRVPSRSPHPFETTSPGRAARAAAPAPRSPEEVEADRMDVDEPFQDDGAAGQEHSPIGQTNSDEADVEDMLREGKMESIEVLDSDDERIHQSMVGDIQGRATAAQTSGQAISGSGRLLKGALKLALDESQEAETSGGAVSSAGNASSVRTPPVSTGLPSQASRPSAARPSAVTPLQRQPTNGSASSEGTVPMPGTRAKEVKTRQKEELKLTPYTPPSGTRAAEAATSGLALRTRVVRRR